MRITASDISPSEIERESKLRLESTVTADTDVTASMPWFAFTPDDGSRPSTWGNGAWRTSRGSSIAQTPVVGQMIALSPGYYLAWLRVDVAGEQHVLRIGTLRVR